MDRYYYSNSIAEFSNSAPDVVLGALTRNNQFPLEINQKNAWLEQIHILKDALFDFEGKIYWEYSIPRMGRRIDVLVIIGHVIFVIEFKIGQEEFEISAVNQVWDYALDLKNFHETSHDVFIAPVLVCTAAAVNVFTVRATPHNDKMLFPIRANTKMLREVVGKVIEFCSGEAIDCDFWESGRYHPTPTIIEAAMALYNGHSVNEIARNESGINLTETSEAISAIISESQQRHMKSICLITGVPGAGKTLVGLNIATKHQDKSNDLYSVFLSGNGPLVAILREALARDRVRQERDKGRRIRKGTIMSEVKSFIQNVHHFRDECLIDQKPPIEHVALFDEAQRAWDLRETASFMRRKKNKSNFQQSEPQFLISCLNRHQDWAVIVCLVGGGQEINRGEAGISEWIRSLIEYFPDWHIFLSSRLTDSEYSAGQVLEQLKFRSNVSYKDELHLAVSMRSFRAENVSLLVKQILDLDLNAARSTHSQLSPNYPIILTRDLAKAKRWLREKARGTERYGIVVSSQAERLKPHAIDVKSPVDPIHWFLDGPEDVRSSYYLEDVGTEFDVQGLELDWSCVTWDADFRFTKNGWEHWSFTGDRWNHIHKERRKRYLKNAYRVLLTRSRQGMAIVVPPGDSEDPTRKPEYYDSTFNYLQEIGLPTI